MTKIHTNLLFFYTIIISRVKYFSLLDHRGLISLVTLHARSVKPSNKFFHKFPSFKCSLHFFNLSPHFPPMTQIPLVYSQVERVLFPSNFTLASGSIIYIFFRLPFLWLNYSPNIFLQPSLIIAFY